MKKNLAPEKKGFWKKDYITYRRLWLDSCLNAFSNEMQGIVIDLGGKREKKRGSFQPPTNQVLAWLYLNLDMNTNPDIFSDVNCVPLKNQSIDSIICTEVLEHLPSPQTCVDEIHRLLREGGLAFVSTPFFYPVHADPYDFQRFTEDGLRYLFRNFKSVEIYRMGGYWGVLGLMVELGISGIEEKKMSQRITRWMMKWISRWLCRLDISVYSHENTSRQKFTTGYFLKAIK